ncbi:D-amino-acid oxidase [Geopyxis carbonaria]|nr:D-amino-acid oxidase [Geopyxis carbonaria]
MSENSNVVVVGAGVIGLTTALLLARQGNCNVTIVAKHMPGDYDIEYTSPWAGANWWPVSNSGTEHADQERITFHELWHLAKNVPQAGIHVQDSVIYNRNKDTDKTSITDRFNELLAEEPWFKDLAPGFRKLKQEELPKNLGVDSGTIFKSVCINTAIYLPYLVSCCVALGVTVKRGVVEHICDAVSMHASGIRADVVVNCTGISARKIGGVMDKNVIPIRGQIVIVRNVAPAMICSSGTDEAEDDNMYIMTRAAGGGTVIGGCYQKNNWESQPDPNLALRMMKRAVEYCPQLVKPDQGVEGLDVIRHGVGLRPFRIGGTRIESEKINDVTVVHNYGAGGFGYQASYGMAQYALKLVNCALITRANL